MAGMLTVYTRELLAFLSQSRTDDRSFESRRFGPSLNGRNLDEFICQDVTTQLALPDKCHRPEFVISALLLNPLRQIRQLIIASQETTIAE